MTIRIPLLLLCAFILCETLSADEAAPKKEVKAKKVVAVAGAAGAVQVQVLKKTLEAQKEVAKKLAEAIKAEGAAKNELAEAEKEAAAAQGEEEKQTANKRVDEAKKKLEAATKEAVKQRAANKKVAAQAVAVRNLSYYANVAVRENVDPQDPIERFMLLTTGGPIVVQVAMSIDGKPFRTKREALIDELLAVADTNEDGKPTWEEALKSARFTLGRIQVTNDQQRATYLKMWDKNKNGLVDRTEARTFVAQLYRAPAFTLSGNSGYGYARAGVVFAANGRVYRGGGQADVTKLLDVNKDGVLSKKEIAAAGERLKSRDADDNDLLYPNEISGPVTAKNQQKIRAVARQPQKQLAVLLGPTAKAEPLFKALQDYYKNDAGEVVASSFSALPKLFETLDKNTDGKLQQDEVMALNDVEPQLDLAIDLGSSEKGPKGLKVKAISSELTKSEGSNKSVSVELPGIKLSFVANLAAPQTYNYANAAKSYLTRYDKDSNGYLEKKELPANFRQFDVWDGDSDGKVYEKEITASYTRMLAPQMSQIRANASSQGNSLFQALDPSGDGRLSLREMRTADQQLTKFDENSDDQITQAEIPVALSVHFGLGNARYSYRVGQGTQPGTARTANNDAPEWFTRMDRNGDGDLTLKEFLGGKEEFEKLDTNNDGFIEPKEAKAISESK